MTELEQQLGLKLLDRTTREVALTDASRSLAVRLERVREELDTVLLDHASGSRRLIDEALRDQGVQAPVAQEVGHATTIFRMLDAGLGISIVPTLALPPAGLQGLEVRPLVPKVERSIVLVRRANRALAPVAEVAWGLVRGVAAERA